MNDSKSIVVCEECSRKMRRRPHKFEEYVLYMIPDQVRCGVCRCLVPESSRPHLFSLDARRFCYVYRPKVDVFSPYTSVTIDYSNVTSRSTSTLDWPGSYTFG